MTGTRFLHILSLLIVMTYSMTLCCTDQESFLQGNKLYNDHEYEQALKKYESIRNKGSAVWYNMGNCAYFLTHYSDALLYWRTSERHASRKTLEAIAHNIHALEPHIPHLASLQPTSIAYSRKAYMLSLVSPLAMQCIALMLLVLLCMVCFYMKKSSIKTIVLCCCIAVLMMVLGFVYLHYQRAYTKQGIITSDNAIVTVGPNKNYHQIGKIPRNAECVIRSQDGSWYNIRYNNLVGWIFTDTISTF